jgi:hypothetical protein
MKEDESLPQRCCSKCGFLYGLASYPASRDDAIFDPDLIRLEDYSPAVVERQQNFKRGIITSFPYVSQKYWKPQLGTEPPPGQTFIADPPIINNYSWADTLTICCYKNMFRARSVWHSGITVTEQDDLSTHVPMTLNGILQEIRKDRQECGGFFEYHPGYSPSQHIELHLEEKRIERQEQHERKLSEWSYRQESRWSQISLELDKKRMDQEKAWRKIEANLTIRLSIIGAILIAIQTLVMVILGNSQ